MIKNQVPKYLLSYLGCAASTCDICTWKIKIRIYLDSPKNPSFSIVSSLSMQFSDWKSSVKILSVVGVRTDEEFVVAKEFVEAVSHAPTNNPRLTFCVFWTIVSRRIASAFSAAQRWGKNFEWVTCVDFGWSWITRQTSGWVKVWTRIELSDVCIRPLSLKECRCRSTLGLSWRSLWDFHAPSSRLSGHARSCTLSVELHCCGDQATLQISVVQPNFLKKTPVLMANLWLNNPFWYRFVTYFTYSLLIAQTPPLLRKVSNLRWRHKPVACALQPCTT